MPRIIARSLDGVEIPFQMLQGGDSHTQPQIPCQTLQTESTLAQSQRALLEMFRKPIQSTWAIVVIDIVTYSEPDSKPFVELREGMEIQIRFRPAREQLQVQLISNDYIIELPVRRRAYLQQVRDFLSVLLPTRWPWPNTDVLICPQQHEAFADFEDLLLIM